ncbi:transporter substrate-binding domain-containing protein [Brevibacillus sp. SYP-B805]|uniref:transporter substrate-binding domain-containing protein n=1 Tax=Brevibacillus sp. SYP-B805 TaxID=1578199 RepID=UPI0013ECC097|nr:transporter substrate-binding domain-containing protein [Brevibacillus sp. SYP-B805]NGQ95702.1 transporter substrate-binding domain-containing protein [Brevibacillus sp. SYP-B805]
MGRFLACLACLLSCWLAAVPASAVNDQEVIRVAFDRNLPPFSSVDENGDAAGLSIDLIRAIAQLQGYRVEWVPAEWEDALALLKNGRVDVIAGMKYTSTRDKLFDFSESYFTMSEVLLVPKSNQSIYTLNHLKDKVVSVQRESTSIDLLESVRRVKMLVAFSEPDAIQYLVLGRSDAYIGNRWTAEYTLRKLHKWDEYEARSGMINPTDYALAVREGNYALLHELNDGLAAVYRDGTYSRIYSHYFEPYAAHLTDFWRKMVIGLVGLIAVIAMGLLLSFFWNKRLKAEVRKQTMALADFLAFQRTVLDNTESAIISLDPDGRITLINQTARQLLHLDEGAMGDTLEKRLPQLLIPPVWKAGERRQYEGEIHYSDGTLRILHYYVAPFANRIGEAAGWIVSLQDRTEQKHLQARLIAQEKMRALGQLVAGIAHELRNPLTAIKAFVELLPRKLDDRRFRDELLRYVPEEVERMNRILEDLLDYSRSKPIQMEKVYIKELVGSVSGLFAKRFAAEGIDVELQIPAEAWVWGDRARLKQILINFVLNAMEAMACKEEKRLRLALREAGNELRLSITDTGEGIAESDLPHLFQPFYTTKSQGIGLGLYLSDRIMREHGGRIEVTSQKGRGSTFILCFRPDRQPDTEREEEAYAEAANYRR